jgi:protein LTV1
MHEVLPGETYTDKLGTIRKSFKEIGYDPYAHLEEDDNNDDTVEDLIEEKKDRWDCETVLSTSTDNFLRPGDSNSLVLGTYSNLENHPRMIRARGASKPPKITINPKTGVPTVQTATTEATGNAEAFQSELSRRKFYIIPMMTRQFKGFPKL